MTGADGGAIPRGWRWDDGLGGVDVLVVCRGHGAREYARPGPAAAARLWCVAAAQGKEEGGSWEGWVLQLGSGGL